MEVLVSNELINISFKGNRNYVYASDLFDLIIVTVKKIGIKKIEDIDYSVHNILNNKVNFSLYKLDEIEKLDTQSDVRLNFKSEGINYVGLIFGNDLDIDSRTNYDEEEIFQNSEINEKEKSINLKNNYNNYTNLDVFTSLNKRLLSEVRPDIKGKWVSVRLQIKSFSELIEERNLFKVKLVKIFSNKYTRSELYNNDKRIGYLYFSII